MGPDVKDLCEIGNPAGVETTVSYANLSKPQASLTSLSCDAQNSAAVSLTTLGYHRGNPHCPILNKDQNSLGRAITIWLQLKKDCQPRENHGNSSGLSINFKKI